MCSRTRSRGAAPPGSARQVRRRGRAPASRTTQAPDPDNNALVPAAHLHGVGAARSPATVGAWVENACPAHAWNPGPRLHCWREDPLGLRVRDGRYLERPGNLVVDQAGVHERPAALGRCRRTSRANPRIRLVLEARGTAR